MKLEKKWQSVYGRVMVAADLTSLNSLLSLPPDWQLLRIYSPPFFWQESPAASWKSKKNPKKIDFIPR